MARRKSVTLNLRIEPELKAAAEKAAAAERRSLTTLIEMAVAEYLQRRDPGFAEPARVFKPAARNKSEG
jgi:hypothetical protein